MVRVYVVMFVWNIRKTHKKAQQGGKSITECVNVFSVSQKERSKEGSRGEKCWFGSLEGKCGRNKKGKKEKLVQGTFCGKHTTT